MNQDLSQNQNKKYQDALDFLQEECRTIKKGESKKHVELLQNLVDRATPKKVKCVTGLYKKEWHCPNCDEEILDIANFCHFCGQAINWKTKEYMDEFDTPVDIEVPEEFKNNNEFNF